MSGKPIPSPQPTQPAQPQPTQPSKKRKKATQFSPSDVGNAQLLHYLFGGKICHDAAADRWLLKSDNGLWREDQEFKIYQIVWETNKLRRADAMEMKAPTALAKEEKARQIAWSHKSDSHHSIQNCLAQARALLSVKPDKFDGDPWLLGCPDRLIDLRTGQVTTPTKETFISKTTKISPADKADCPLWLDFLNKALRGDQEVISYLKRLAGYSLTGSTREQALTWFVGGGGNGKSTFLDCLHEIMGDYAHTMRTEPLMMSRHETHPTELMDLKGKRLVVAQETEEGRTWRLVQLKRLTSSDPITARRVHRDSVTFLPSHSLIISCNNQPILSNVGEAERRRFQIVEWKATFKFPDDKTFNPRTDIVRDGRFAFKLEAEYPQILRWMLDGCIEWLELGLTPPASVTTSSDSYLETMDSIQMWLDQCTLRPSDGFELNSRLWASWTQWCKVQGYFPGLGITHLTSQLKNKGFAISKRNSEHTARGVVGIRLIADPEEDDSDGPVSVEIKGKVN
jgi:putative DNA primase/helicase